MGWGGGARLGRDGRIRAKTLCLTPQNTEDSSSNVSKLESRKYICVSCAVTRILIYNIRNISPGPDLFKW